MRKLAAAIAAALLLLPVAAAHLDRERPHVQQSEARRDLTFTSTGTTGRIDLAFTLDRLRDSITHVVDPTKGVYDTQYRVDPSDASTAFSTRWTWVQFVEYRDANADGTFQPGVDPVVHSWKPSAYAWNVTPPRTVTIAGQTAKDMAWNGTIAGGPHIDIEIASLGVATIDEGARIRPQDYILYLDMNDYPPRQVGSLYALEWLITPPKDVTIGFDEVTINNETIRVGARVENAERLAFLDWGAQATLDGEEAFLNATLSQPDANGNRSMYLNFPRFDTTLHMVWVVGVEYVTPLQRGTPAVGPLTVFLSVILVVCLTSRKRVTVHEREF